MYNPKGTILEVESLVVGLSVEELTLITGAMGLPEFLGFTPPTEMPGPAAQAGERSLRVRHLAEVSPENGGTLVINSAIVKLLSVCAAPTHALIILTSFPDGGIIDPYRPDGEKEIARAHFFCVNGTDLVYHNRTLPGLHTFTTVAEPDTLKLMLGAILVGENPSAVPDAPNEPFTLSQEALFEVQEIDERDGAEAAYDRLFNGLNAPHSLARALTKNTQFVVYLMRRNDWESGELDWSDSTDLEEIGTFVVPAEEDGLWVYAPEGEETVTLTFNPTSAEAFIEELVDRFHAAMTTQS